MITAIGRKISKYSYYSRDGTDALLLEWVVLYPRAVVRNLWYAYLWGGYAKIILVMAENTKKKEELK
jgi:hypothetical protein